MDFSVFVFLAVSMVTFGYIAGNSHSFNFWKTAMLSIFLIPFVVQFNLGKPHLITMLVGFIFGYILPYAHLLEGLRDAISDFINAIRYKDAYEEIRRKEEEVENLRRQYEEAQRRSNQNQYREEQQRRQEQSQQHRKSQENQEQRKEESSQKHKKKQQKSQSSTNSGSTSTRSRYLVILGLDPEKQYDYKEIKKAYRRQANKYHPDKHQGKPDAEMKEMTKRFQEVQTAFEWLATK